MGLLSWLFGNRKSENTQQPITRRSTPKASIKWRDGSFPMEVVGEANYQDALKDICGGYNRHGQELELSAEIEREPNNQYDKNAVVVLVGGHTVGYLNREQAKRVSSQMVTDGIDHSRCKAKIVGGWRTNQHDSGHFGVKLNIPSWGWIDFGLGKNAPDTKPEKRESRTQKPKAASSGPLVGEWIVVWGAPKYGEVAQELAALGANIMAGVGKSTTMVVHIEEELTVGARLSSTFEKAQKRIEEGANLEMVSLHALRERIGKNS